MAIRMLSGRRPAAGRNQVAWQRLFCFPHAGAGAAVFSRWPDYLPSNVELCVPCLPGRDARIDEPPASAMMPLVANLAQEMLPLLSLPYALFGHSMGAFIAFDLAHELSELGYPPAHLFVSAQRGPSLPYPGRKIYALPENEFLAGVLARYANIPKQVLEQKDLMAVLLRTLRGDFTLTEDYRYRAAGPLACPVTAFGGTDDKHVAREQLEAWAAETTNRFRLHLLPGGHFFHQESREELLSLIGANLYL
jgi:medium-chain acyl-[acyl-carrier-protein] hydrolase